MTNTPEVCLIDSVKKKLEKYRRDSVINHYRIDKYTREIAKEIIKLIQNPDSNTL